MSLKPSQRFATYADAGQAAEHFVAADLLNRGFVVTKPLNTNGAHDLHAKISGKWTTIQVKCALRNVRTGTLQPGGGNSRRKHVESDVLALVHLDTWSIRYINVKDGSECFFSNSTAVSATRSMNASLPQSKSTTDSTASSVARS